MISSSNSSIKLGSHHVKRIEYDKIKPGDFICTYEALNTQPELLHLESIFLSSNPSRPPEFAKMFHAEVITHTYNRPGVYRIAHGDGVIQKIVAQDDNFKSHHPGQAFIVFRAKNKEVRKEIIAIATKTSEPESGHICKALFLNSFLQRHQYALNFLAFENSNSNSEIVKNVAQLVINYEESGKFYNSEGLGAKEMNCVQYVAHVVNVAAVRILCRLFSSEQSLDKMSSLCEQILQMNKDNDLPLKFSFTDATPSGFVAFLLNNNAHFKTVGYLGAISDQTDEPSLDIKGKTLQITPQLLSDFLSDISLHSDYAARVMKALGIIDRNWRIDPKLAADPVKLRTFFEWITGKFSISSHMKNSQNEELNPQIFQRNMLLFLEKVEQIDSENKNLSPIHSLSPQEIKEILLLEKEILKITSMQSTEKTFKLSMNTLATAIVELREYKRNFTQLFSNSLASNSTATYFFKQFLKSEHTEHLERIAKEKTVCLKFIEKIQTVHEKNRENGSLLLHSDTIPSEYRPWIHFSLNSGKTWDVKPLILEHPLWKANMGVSNDVIYKLFVGPKDMEDPDPILKVQAWQKTNNETGIFVSSKTFQNIPKSPFFLIDTSTHPQWSDEKNPLNRSEQLFLYEKQCDAIAPLQQHPLVIDEYESKYSDLEAELKPIEKKQNLLYDEQIISSLQNFLKKELGLHVSSRHIQFMKGGLGKGLSGDRIYFIFDSNHRPCLAVKVFMKSRGKFSREFLTLMNHEKLNLKYLGIPTAAAVSAAEVDNHRIYFLATPYIPGTSVYDLFMGLFAEKVGSRKRGELLNHLSKIYAKLGQGIGEFHNSAKGETLAMHPAFINLLEKFTTNAFIKFKDHLEPKFLEELMHFFKNNFSQECERKFVRGYFHGDINAGNLIYNPVTERLSLIDWPDGSSSVGQKGEPQGISFYDLIQIKSELENRKTQGLTHEEFSQIHKTFINNYLEIGPPIPPKSTMHFFAFIDMIGSIKWFLDKKEIFTNQISIAEKIYKFKLNELKKLLIAANKL